MSNKVSVKSDQPQPSPFNYENDFHQKFFDCCADPKNAAIAFFCMPLALCKLGQHTGECFCTTFLCPVSSVMLRTKIRTHYKIKGALWKDVVAMGFCPCCALLQMIAEVRANEDI